MAQCAATGKRIWPSETAADAALGRIWARCKPGRRLESRYYLCDSCGHWHLTSKPLREDQRENGTAA